MSERKVIEMEAKPKEATKQRCKMCGSRVRILRGELCKRCFDLTMIAPIFGEPT